MKIMAAFRNLVGHVSPAQGFLRHAPQFGHEYCYLAREEIPPRVAALIGKSEVIHLKTQPPEPPPHADFFSDLYYVYRNRDVMKQLMRYFISENGEAQTTAIHDLERAIKENKIDVVLTDATMTWVVAAAERAGVPWLTLPCGFPPLCTNRPGLEFELADEMAGERDALFAKHGVRAPKWVQMIMVSPYLNIIASSPEFAGTQQRIPFESSFIGPLTHISTEELMAMPVPKDLPDKPFVYVCFGSLARDSICGKIMTYVAQACHEIGVPCVVVMGNNVLDSSLTDLKKLGTKVYDYVPQFGVLARGANVFVTQGGMNAFNEAILTEVPMLAVPCFFDHIDGAHLIQRSGMGEFLMPEGANPSTIRAAIEKLILNNAKYRQRVAKIKDACLKTGGVAEAFERIEKIIGK